MEEPYEQLLRVMELAFEKLASQVPPPQPALFGPNKFVFRYKERTLKQAIVQKLARIISGLRAALLLLRNGLLQEQAVIQRVLDEFCEDVLFLSYGALQGETGNPQFFSSSVLPRGI
jgi:hypothetical protein